MRWALVLVCCISACKKAKEPDPEPAPTAGSTGHSSTKLNDEAQEHGGSEGAGAAHGSGEEADKPLYGGNGKPAYRDEDGHVHGPGGPIFMGKGPECNDKIDHCLRPGVWFAVGNIQPGKLFRATPAFELEGKWWNFREETIDDYYALYKTKVAERASELQAGSPVIWLVDDNSGDKWVASEHDALTSSRWEAGVVESVSGSTFKVQGWDHAVPIEMARVIVDQKKK